MIFFFLEMINHSKTKINKNKCKSSRVYKTRGLTYCPQRRGDNAAWFRGLRPRCTRQPGRCWRNIRWMPECTDGYRSPDTPSTWTEPATHPIRSTQFQDFLAKLLPFQKTYPITSVGTSLLPSRFPLDAPACKSSCPLP